MRIGKKIVTPGRILFLLLATAFPWKAVAEEVPFPVSRYVEAALADNPSLESIRERIRMKENAAIKAGAINHLDGTVSGLGYLGFLVGPPAIGFLSELKSEENMIIRQWKDAGLTVENAADSQALIQLRKEYCDKKNCLHCRFGYEYLRSN